MPRAATGFSKPINSLVPGDALSQILSSIGISGSLLLQEEYCSPWAVSVPHFKQLNTLLNTTDDIRVVTFHLVERGYIHIKFDNGDVQMVEAGEMVVCFSGLGHTLYQGSSQKLMPFQDIMAGMENIFKPDAEKKQLSTSLVCGVFLLHDTLLNPLLAALPHLLKLSVVNANDFPRLNGVINLMVQEFKYQSAGNQFVMERYLEILCAETIRAYLDSLPQQATGWLAALKDPIIGRTIEIIHAQPGHPWTVKKLASEVAISPSRLAARFVATAGEPPKAYLTKWRIFIACRQLKDQRKNIADIAHEVGYENLASFNRAFKRHIGRPPASWRKSFKTPENSK